MHRLLVLLLIAGLHGGCAGESTVSPTGVREGFVTTPDGVGLYFRVVGSGAETVIAPNALYHGDSLDSLADGRRVVTYDPRGRGRSDSVPADKISLDHLLIDIDTVRQAVGAEKVAIIGWSGPGMEMFVYALRNPQSGCRASANARLLIVSGAGHWPHYEQPEVTLEAIDVFLGGGWPADAVSLP